MARGEEQMALIVKNDKVAIDPTQGGEAAYLPFRYHADFIDYLAAAPDLFQIVTYDDLMWQEESPEAISYPREKEVWQRAMRDGRLSKGKIYVLIQHDVDTRPERTLKLLEYEAEKGVRSNVMIFNKRVDRRRLAATLPFPLVPEV
jgi:hypothetical protein